MFDMQSQIIWRKWLILGVIAAVILTIIWVAVVFIGRIGKTPFEVKVLPGDARITIDGTLASNGINYLKKGTYTIEIRRDGFTGVKQKITVSDDEDTNYLALALEAKTDAARKYITDHAQEYTEFEGFVGVKQATIGAKFTEQNPLTTALPYRDAYYTIGYTDTPSKGLVITIHSSSPRYRYAALQKIRDLGYDPVNYRFQFVNYTNPLEATR